ncbi:tetratricopeptide repeat protein [Bacillus songklensis]|uniref:Tetratricopeptide repeat protein n=1 Tax=Bacillus songklensis TaxID=1069116 RepID=A0ABV8B0G6_9BACI
MSSKDLGKVVSFPNLKRRIIEKATSLMEVKKYHEALPLFHQAVELDEENPELLIGLIMCLFEVGELKEAKRRCKGMLHQGIGDYYNVLQIYMMVLIQDGAYDEGYETLSAVLQEQRLPAEHAEHFYKLYEFFKIRTSGDDVVGESEEERWESFRRATLNHQMDMIRSLKGADIKRYVSFCRKILKEEQIHPIVKTLIARWILQEELNITAELTKFNRHLTIDLPYLQSVVQHTFIQEVEKTIEQHIGQLNPTLLQVAQELWHRHLFMLFPFLPEPMDAITWASAIHYVAMDMQGLHSSAEYMTELYGIGEEELIQAVETVREIEEFSTI